MSIAGLIAPSSGQVLVNGKEVNGPPANLVLVFQEYNKSSVRLALGAGKRRASV